MTNPLLEARELTVSRGGEPLFEDLSFALEGGRVLTLTGPNGSGKTTLLRALCGLVQPDAGELLWRGEAIERSPDFKQNVTYVGHRAGLHGDLSAAENLDFLARVQATTTPSRVAPAFSRLDATRFAHQPLHSLSAGQQRRAALARLLLNDAVV